MTSELGGGKSHRCNQVLLAEDAMHSLPAVSGVGLSSGLADVDNLAKIAVIYHGHER